MVEAVTSAISNAQIASPAQTQAAAKIVAQQVSSASNVATDNVARAPVAPFISPYISLDNGGVAVLQIRDSDTGEVQTQFPSEPTIQQREAQAIRRDSQRGEVVTQELAQPTQAARTEVASSTFQASIIAQQSSAGSSNVGTSAGTAQAAIAALSAGAQSGQGGSTALNSITA